MKLARITLMVIGTVAALTVAVPATAAPTSANTHAKAPAPMPARSLLQAAAAPGRVAAPSGRAATGPALAGDALVEGSTLASGFFYNESGKSVTLDSLGTGESDIVFAGLGGIAVGNVQVSAQESYGTCEPYDWGPNSSHTEFVVLVDCFEDGSLANVNFFVTVTQPRSRPGGVYDYVVMNRPTSSGKLTGGAQYNSEGKPNSVKHLGTGRYQVLLGGKRTTGTTGVVKVSPFGTAPAFCNPTGWKGSRTGEVVDVDCYGPSGAAENEIFSLAYATRTNVMGSDKLGTANVYANGSAAVYQPSDQYVSRRGGRVTVVHTNLGFYEVLVSGLPSPASNLGDFQFNAVSTRGVCSVETYFEAQSVKYVTAIEIVCVNTKGTVTNLPFDLEFAVP
jgi:hypothetical protein